MEYDKLLIVCVDRDADIHKKIGEKGPIYGRKKLLEVAVALGLKDPAESDTNALFEAIKLGDELKREGKEVKLAALVGDENIGVVSDMKLSKQFDEVLNKYKIKDVIVVTDGIGDEHVLPIVESKANIVSLRRVIVKQSEQLESTYYMLQDFLKDIVSDPKLSRLVIGLPAIVLILYGIFGQYGWRLILGIAGVFLFIKGFNLEGTVQKAYDELKSSLIGGRISFFTYAVAALIAVIGVVSGYDELAKMGYTNSNAIPIFISGSIDLLAFAAIVALIGKGIDAILEQEEILRYFIYSAFVIAFWLILDATSLFLLGKISRVYLAVSIILGLILPTIAILIKKSVRRT